MRFRPIAAAVALVLPVAAQESSPTSTESPSASSPTSSSSSSTASAGSASSTPTPSPSTSAVPSAVFYDSAEKFSGTGTPTSGSSAYIGAPTYTIKSPNGEVQAVLDATRPVVVLEFDFDVPDVALTFNLLTPKGDFQVPRVLVSTKKNTDGVHYYYPGNAYADKLSGGTASGGYNARNGDTWEVRWDRGYANWTYGYAADHTLAPGATTVRPSFLVGLGIDEQILYDPTRVNAGSSIKLAAGLFTSKNNALSGSYQLSMLRPFVGDSTDTDAMVFTPVLYDDPIPQPTYPNYTLPDAQLVLDDWTAILGTTTQNTTTTTASNFPFGRTNHSLVVIETELAPISHGLGNSMGALDEATDRAMAASGIGNITQWMSIANQEGFRYWQQFSGLKPNTNYTLWAKSKDNDDGEGILSQPVWFVTKSAGFPCTLLPPSDVCPGVAYAVPFAATSTTLRTTEIPADLNTTILDSIGNFSISLTANGLACGRDMYSYVSTCLDCYNAYRNWVCHITIPRCADPNAAPFQNTSGRGAPTAPFTVARSASAPRNNATQVGYGIDTDYTEMLPCLGLCTKVERKCPNTLGWTCPHRNFNAASSYGYIGKSNKNNDGSPRTGYPAQDQWGNRWCNGG